MTRTQYIVTKTRQEPKENHTEHEISSYIHKRHQSDRHQTIPGHGGATGTRACRDRRKMTIGQYFSIVSLLAEKVRHVKFCDRPDLFCACRVVPVHPCTEIDLAHRVLTHAASIGEVRLFSICRLMALPSELNREFHVIAPEVSQRTSQPVANQCCVSISYLKVHIHMFS